MPYNYGAGQEGTDWGSKLDSSRVAIPGPLGNHFSGLSLINNLRSCVRHFDKKAT